ncbi:MAG: hypothetical protein AB1649_25825, partial [Chloroflexota bacterium]
MNIHVGRVVVLLASAYILLFMSRDFYQIAWGTGEWLGQFSLKWGLVFFTLVALSIVGLFGLGNALWRPQQFRVLFGRLVGGRNRIGWLRWPLSAVVLLLPAYLLQFTPWGAVFYGTYIRIVIWLVT